jgi:hypothetical protein
VTRSEHGPILRGFRLHHIAEEFENHSRAEIERLRGSDPDFDEQLYQQAIDLVLRKLSQYTARET